MKTLRGHITFPPVSQLQKQFKKVQKKEKETNEKTNKENKQTKRKNNNNKLTNITAERIFLGFISNACSSIFMQSKMTTSK